tara:strand:+ start:316 stop:654 length:339 start_codon:yes stop_codon:yes gene_type:complete
MTDEPILKVCVRCGIIYYIGTDFHTDYWYCKDCKRIISATRAKGLAADKRAEGYISKSRKKAGRKAYYSRMANLYFNDRERFDRLFAALRARAPMRAGQVTRRINERTKISN